MPTSFTGSSLSLPRHEKTERVWTPLMDSFTNVDIVIVGAGIAGLATSLGLHRLGLRSLVLESSDGLRVSGFAIATWTNAWRVLDALGVADSIRQQHLLLTKLQVFSAFSGLPTSGVSFESTGKLGKHETRCLKRNVLLETLEKELPHGTIRYSSKVVSIEESGCFKYVHLADGSVIRAKVLIGCDGVNSVVAKYLSLPKPVMVGRFAIRAFIEFPEDHRFGTSFCQYTGEGVRHGYVPVDSKTIYWFFTFSAPTHNEIEGSPAKMKQFVLSKLGKVSPQVQEVVENTKLENMLCTQLKLRLPWQVLFGNISKGNVCVAGDALHPMTPDIGQGACAALEDAIVLARCIGEAFRAKPDSGETEGEDMEEAQQYTRIKNGLEKFASERRWRSFRFIATAYLVGFMQQSDGLVMRFIRERLLSKFMARTLLKIADHDSGTLSS